jgi:tetratricopeptide (TPR) repeat protein
VHAAEGEILMAAGKPAAAAEAFATALRQQPTAAIAMKAYLARVSARLPDPALPLQSYVDSHRYDMSARGALAQAYQQLGESQRAMVEYEKMLAEGAASPLLLNNLAWLYSEAGDKRALATARQAVAMAPTNPAIVDTLGWILLGQGQIAEAVSVLKSAVAGAQKDAEIRYHYALALAKSGAAADATRNVAEALRLAESFPSRAAAERLQKELSNGTTANRPTG